MPDQVFTSGQVLTASQMTSLQSNIGLSFIKAQTIGSAVPSVTVSDAFSATFDAYRVVITACDSADADKAVEMTFGSSATGYFSAGRGFSYLGGTAEFNRNNDVSAFTFITSQNDDCNASFDIYNPFLAKRTTFAGTSYSFNYSTFFGGTHTVASSFSSFTLKPATGSFTGGIIAVYGYRKS